MITLIKYELLKRKNLLITALSILMVLETTVLLGANLGGNWMLMALLSMALICVGVYIFTLISNIDSYSRDINREQGYLLFLTPRNGYKVVGSKVTVLGIELLVFTSIAFLFMTVNIELISTMLNSSLSPKVLNTLNRFTKFYKDVTPTTIQLLGLTVNQLIKWFGLIITVFSAMTLRKTLLSNSKSSNIISFLLFLLGYGIINTININILSAMGFLSEYTDSLSALTAGKDIMENLFSETIGKLLITDSVLSIIWSLILYLGTAKLVNDKIDL